MERSAHNSNYVIVSLTQPLLWSRTSEETWPLQPHRRYIINSNHVEHIAPYVDTMSDLKTSTDYKPLWVDQTNLVKSRILVERNRDRGIGDLLFLTGIFAYLQNIASNEAKIYTYALADRGQCLAANPHIFHRTPLYGPIEYNDLRDFDYHWFIETSTEHSEEGDQLNVYDALFKDIGVDYTTVNPIFKRPVVTLTQDDMTNVDSTYYFIGQDRKIDLRKVPYYVVSPMANGNLRNGSYQMWLAAIQEMAKLRPVILVGRIAEGRMPATDMTFGAFFKALNEMDNPNVINLMGETPLRIVMALISRAMALVTMDSGLLYVAQGLRVPAISIWGTHDPRVRIGYDLDYMELAIWQKDACQEAPCFAYDRLPLHKCPEKTNQRICEVLRVVHPSHILEKLNIIEQRFTKAVKSGGFIP